MRGHDNTMRAYRNTLPGVAPLGREEERDLTRRWRAGDKRAGDSLVVACLPFVLSIALEYRRWGVPLEDVVQQGNLGLLHAAAKFDLGKDCRLATYAAYWIRAEIRDYVVRTYRVVRLGTTKAERRALRAYRKTRESDPAALAAASGMTREKAERLLPLLEGREASLDARTDDHGSLMDRLPGVLPSPEEQSGAHERQGRARQAVDEAMLELDDRERMIVRERLMSDDPQTLQELGAKLGVSKERVRQLEERACVKLRAKLAVLREVTTRAAIGNPRERVHGGVNCGQEEAPRPLETLLVPLVRSVASSAALALNIRGLVEHGAIPLSFPDIPPSVRLARRQDLLRAANDGLPENAPSDSQRFSGVRE